MRGNYRNEFTGRPAVVVLHCEIILVAPPCAVGGGHYVINFMAFPAAVIHNVMGNVMFARSLQRRQKKQTELDPHTMT